MQEKFVLMGILRPFFRGLPIIMVLMWLAVLAAKRYLNYTTPMYESTAKIKLADTREGVPNSNLYKDFDVFTSSNKIAAEVELLKSKVLIGKALRNLDWQYTIYRVGDLHKTELYDQCPFVLNVSLENEKWYGRTFGLEIGNDSLLAILLPNGKSIRGQMNRVISFEGGSLVVLPNAALMEQRPGLHLNDRYAFVKNNEAGAISHITSNIDVMSVDKEVPVLRISFKSAVAQQSADVANALAAAFISDFIEQKYKSADTAMDFLNRELNMMSGRLAASEDNIESYRDLNNIINIRQETETDLRKISDLKKQQANVQMNLLAIKDLNKYIESGKDNFEELAPNFEAFTDLLSTELVKKVKELQRERRDLLMRYTPENEKVRVVDDKITDIGNYLRESIRNTESNLQIKYNDLNKTIREAEEVFIGLPTREKTMTILERNFSLNEQMYRFLHEKRTEAEIARAATISFHRIISPAEVPAAPVSPSATLLKVLAGFLAFLFGTGGIYLVHVLKGRISDATQIQKSSDTPLLAEIPFLPKAAARSDYFRRWAIELDLTKKLTNGSVLVVTSFDRLEGKRFVTSQLALAMQALGKRVAIVNADGSDMPDVKAPIAEPAQHLQQGSQMGAWLEELKQSCDVVVVKNHAVNGDPRALSFMSTATTNLFLLDSRRTRQSMIMQADLLAQSVQLPAFHFVHNRAGYNPSLLLQALNGAKNILNRFKKNR